MATDSAWLLILSALLLGVRHGFDLDHLATIDSVARTVRSNRLLSKTVGVLFSFGHGCVVILISIIIGSGLWVATVPEWLNGVGDGISIAFLVVFGLLNLWNVFQHPTKHPVPTSVKKYLSSKINFNQVNPLFIILIGVLFAFSFDTVSQVVLFSLTASALSGALFSGLLGLSFMLGMMIADGLNGLFVSSLIQRADGISFFISRTTGLIIASFSLIIAAMNCIKLLE